MRLKRTARREQAAIADNVPVGEPVVVQRFRNTVPGSVNSLPLDNGSEVTQVRFDFAVSLLFEDGAVLRIENRFVLDGDHGRSFIDPEAPGSLAANLAGLHKSLVTTTTIFQDGRLVLQFSTGETIEVPSHERYESWAFLGSASGVQLVCVPGGAIAAWP